MRIVYLTQWFEPEPNIVKGLPFVRAIVRRHGGELMIEDARPGAIVTARF